MSRVLLFVQNGEGRPKCEYRLPAWMPWDALGDACRRQAIGASPRARVVAELALRADQWFLVECENAAAGRLIIACDAGNCDSPEGCVCRTHGRILTQGGRW